MPPPVQLTNQENVKCFSIVSIEKGIDGQIRERERESGQDVSKLQDFSL